MGTGSYVNFGNGDDAFNIALDSAGHLNFLANDQGGSGSLRMAILDDTNEVIFSGSVTVDSAIVIGGSGQYGALQFKASDGDNTIFLGSSADATNMVMGGNGRDGTVQLKNGDGVVTIDLQADEGTLALGGRGQDGDILVFDSAAQTSIRLDGAARTLTMNYGSQAGVVLDGTGSITVGTAGSVGVDGTIDVCNAAGQVTIKLSGDLGLIECDDLQENTIPDGSLVAHQPFQGALARVLALQAISYRAAEADGRGARRIGLRGDDVQRVCPELAETVSEGRTGVNYSRLTALLVEAVKEQQQLIAGLRERLDLLETAAAA